MNDGGKLSIVTPKSKLKSDPKEEYQGSSQPLLAFQRWSLSSGARDTIA